VNCVGDTLISGRPRYESMIISDEYFLHHEPAKIPVSNLVSIPLVFCQMSDMLPLKGGRAGGDKPMTCQTCQQSSQAVDLSLVSNQLK